MENQYDVIVIGAGLGGLATGSLLAQQGRKVIVFEKHTKPGGYATNFERENFAFDVSLHALNGATPGTPSYRFLEKCGVADRVRFLPQKNVYRIVTDKDEMLVKHGGVEQYKKLLLTKFPEEGANLDRLFTEAEKTFKEAAKFLHSSFPFWLRFTLAPLIFPRLVRYEKTTVHEFFSRFTENEELKEILAAQWPYYGLPPKKLSFFYFSYPFFDYLAHGGYSVEGGSQKLSDAMRDVIEEHGGKVVLSSRVTDIHIENNQVCGITARKIGKVTAPAVVSNIVPHEIVRMAGKGAFPSSFHAKLMVMRPSLSGFQMFLGLDCPLSEFGVPEDEYSVFHLPTIDSSAQYKNMMSGKQDGDDTYLFVNYFTNVDPTLAPKGKSTIGIFSLVSGHIWQGLPKSEYREKKAAMVKVLLDRMERKLPGLSQHIEVMEAGTPTTMQKYTASSFGSFNGFEQSVQQSGLFKRFPMHYPVKGLYQVGAWTFPGGGYLGAMMSAQALVDRHFRKKRGLGRLLPGVF